MTWLLTHWRAVLAFLLLSAIAIQTLRLDRSQKEFQAFKVAVEVAGKVQEAETKRRIAQERELKELSDAENKRTTDKLLADIARLRKQRPDSSFVPAAPAGSSRPDLICFDRAEYVRADGAFTAGARGLADEGSKAAVDLDTAKRWAHGM